MFIPYDDFIRYIAGFFDGEGCVQIGKIGTKEKPNYCLRVTIVQNVHEILEQIQKEFGGSLHKKPPSKYNKCTRQGYALTISSREAQTFLRIIKPFTFVKRKQIETALTFYETIENKKSRNVDETSKNARIAIKEEVSRLNKAPIWEPYIIQQKG